MTSANDIITVAVHPDSNCPLENFEYIEIQAAVVSGIECNYLGSFFKHISSTCYVYKFKQAEFANDEINAIFAKRVQQIFVENQRFLYFKKKYSDVADEAEARLTEAIERAQSFKDWYMSDKLERYLQYLRRSSYIQTDEDETVFIHITNIINKLIALV